MKVTNKYSIYLDRRQSDIFIDVMQGDTYTRELEFSLYSGGTAWTIPPATSVAVAYSGPSGKGIYDTLPDGAMASSVDQNIVTVILVPQIMSKAGRTKVSILFADENGRQLSTFSVTVRVAGNPADGAGEIGDYINILNWTQAAMAALAAELTAELSAKLDQHTEHLAQSFCYAAEDDGEGNVTVKPFHLGGFTDTTLSKPGVPADAAQVGQELEDKAPGGYGLGGNFLKVYSLDEVDSLRSPGWYLVDAGAIPGVPINGEQVAGIQVVRVDGSDRYGAFCSQTWIDDGIHPDLCRSYSPSSGKWGAFRSSNPCNIGYRIFVTNERHEGFKVQSIMIDAGIVEAGRSTSVDIPIADGFEEFAIIGITRYAMPADGRKWYFGNVSGIEEWAYRSVSYDDMDGDGEAEAETGYCYGLTINNQTDTDMRLKYLIKYTIVW